MDGPWQVGARPRPHAWEAWNLQVTPNVEGMRLQRWTLPGPMSAWVYTRMPPVVLLICTSARSLVKVSECVCFQEWTLAGGCVWQLRKATLPSGEQPLGFGGQPLAPAPLVSQGGKTADKGHVHPGTHRYNPEGRESATLT